LWEDVTSILFEKGYVEMRRLNYIVRSSMSRLLNQPLIPSYNVDTLTNNIILDTVLTPKSKDQLLLYITSQEEIVELSLTYGELLWAVWQTIYNLGEFDEETQIQIKQILNQELEDSDCKCLLAG